jgi:hypothetical protein
MTTLQSVLQRWPQNTKQEDDSSQEIEQVIEESRSLLEMEGDWDGEGSPGYSAETWSRAVEFLKDNTRRLRDILGVWGAAPSISPGPNGSIDLHWKTASRELLINIPTDPDQPAGYYGDDSGNNRIKGTLDTSGRNEWLLMWLIESNAHHTEIVSFNRRGRL